MTSEEIKYKEAQKEVKRIKGFYTHAIVYVVINIMVFITNAREIPAGESIIQWRTLMTPITWGIGLLAHGLSVFGNAIFFGQNWEEKKIQELMDKDKSEKWE